MPEYIEREALIAEYDRVHEGPAGGARKLMVDAPAANVVEVVRCKGCKNRNTLGCPVMHYVGDELIGYTEDDAFCSCGERKE